MVCRSSCPRRTLHRLEAMETWLLWAAAAAAQYLAAAIIVLHVKGKVKLGKPCFKLGFRVPTLRFKPKPKIVEVKEPAQVKGPTPVHGKGVVFSINKKELLQQIKKVEEGEA